MNATTKNIFPIVTFNRNGVQKRVQLCSEGAALEYINDVVLRNGWELVSITK